MTDALAHALPAAIVRLGWAGVNADGDDRLTP